jgi:hypothetical protein
MPLVALTALRRRRRPAAALAAAVACVAHFAVLAGRGDTRVLWLWMECLLLAVALIVWLAPTRALWLDAERRTVILRWRSRLFTRVPVELPLARFSHVVSYHPIRHPPRIFVTLVERTGDRELLVDGFGAEYRNRGFWSVPKLVEGASARQLRKRLCALTGLSDGGYRGSCSTLPPSEGARGP